MFKCPDVQIKFYTNIRTKCQPKTLDLVQCSICTLSLDFLQICAQQKKNWRQVHVHMKACQPLFIAAYCPVSFAIECPNWFSRPYPIPKLQIFCTYAMKETSYTHNAYAGCRTHPLLWPMWRWRLMDNNDGTRSTVLIFGLFYFVSYFLCMCFHSTMPL